MAHPGTDAQPLRIAIIGAGPAGFYAAGHLLGQDDLVVEVDLFDRLPTPFGLVRAGVAPDHQKIKNVTRVFDKVAAHERFRFYGHVDFGTHLTVDDLKEHYHQILFCTGAQTDRSLGIPGEDLARSHSATEFVAWYNGHPDFCDLDFDLGREHAVIVGMGNVAVDVARILCRTPEELAATDIADYALEALRRSRIRTVTMLGRRGPAQAAFTYPELKELGELTAADLRIHRGEAALDALSKAALADSSDRLLTKKVEKIQAFAARPAEGKPKTLTIRFLVSPVELLGDGKGGVDRVRLVRNELYEAKGGRLRPRPTEATETIPAGIVFRSIGYRGVPLPGVPFHDAWGTIPHETGRVLERLGGTPVQGFYVAGWIKRGPSGVIGTNKPDAAETAEAMLDDARQGALFSPSAPTAEAAEALVRARQPDVFTYADWQRLDAYETDRGQAEDRPRVKLTRIDEMLAALGRTPQSASSPSLAG